MVYASVLGEEQELDQKRAEVSFRRSRQRAKDGFLVVGVFFSPPDLAKRGMGGTGKFRRQSCWYSPYKIN